ncbi:M1 family metallopeptidase [Zhouia sp. PK063]|uniref:M1 family metallopeptidase n=1 Tax=Zhouia sp. PK063 TaxID=3373602 RepID=UPI0037AC71EA
MKKYILPLTLLLICCCFSLKAQNKNIDVQKYIFKLHISDENDIIKGAATITYKNITKKDTISFDLTSQDETGKGMLVDSVTYNNGNANFEQVDEKLNITLPSITDSIIVYYHGIPKDGLIISKNKYGDRTFFGDNWPNRAHNWLPSIDHPSDKAFVEFYVTAPSHYQVIANGTLIETTNNDDNTTLHHYKSTVPMPTKVMVIGAAKFAVEHLGMVDHIPLSTWVYPENKKAGFYDYAQAEDILNYFTKNIAPFPFSKLANVQSTTRYGGMENASNIFYFENSVTGDRSSEYLLAHEIAHQWFGDSASENDWSQLWLSEGFATYFTDLYAEHAHGEDAFHKKLQEERQKVIAFSKQVTTPIVDTTRYDRLMELLNPNSYQKGAWVLHMLRREVGDKNFWRSIQVYYNMYQNSNATSKDLETVFEKVTDFDLSQFFSQWLHQSGQPILDIDKKLKDDEVRLDIKQKQDALFLFPIDFKITYADGSSEIKTFRMLHKREIYEIPCKKIPVEVIVDPNTWLLYEEAEK